MVAINALANTDKHNTLIAAVPSIKDTEWSLFGSGDFQQLDLSFLRPSPNRQGPVEILRIPLSSPFKGFDIKLHFHVIFTVEPLVGKPVAETITEMARAVEGIIQKFEKHCFGVA